MAVCSSRGFAAKLSLRRACRPPAACRTPSLVDFANSSSLGGFRSCRPCAGLSVFPASLGRNPETAAVHYLWRRAARTSKPRLTASAENGVCSPVQGLFRLRKSAVGGKIFLLTDAAGKRGVPIAGERVLICALSGLEGLGNNNQGDFNVQENHFRGRVAGRDRDERRGERQDLRLLLGSVAGRFRPRPLHGRHHFRRRPRTRSTTACWSSSRARPKSSRASPKAGRFPTTACSTRSSCARA